jgi:hypothetical protein
MPSVHDPTGPDLYGYYAYSSDDNLWQQSPEYDWVEISGIGTEIPRGGASNLTQTVALPFTFKHYGIDYPKVRISTDGWIALAQVNGTQIAFENHSLPYLDDINNMVGVFWDDLFSYGPGEDGKLFYHNDVDNHRFIVEWSEVGHLEDSTNRETFQIILLDPAYYNTLTGDGEIICQYKKVSEPGSSTIGIENNSEDVGIQYVFNEMYALTASELGDNFAIKFTTNGPTVVSVEDEINSENILPDAYVLEQNYPNPFNPETRIRYAIPEPGLVTLRIYRIDGQLVRTLQDANQSPGRYEKVWDGNNEFGNKVSSGVYFYRMQSNNFSQVRKMILLK